MQPLAMLDQGSGPPVLLLHSSGLSSAQWRRLAQRLATTHRVLAPDLPGYGRNPPLDANRLRSYGFEDDLVALEAHLAGLGLEAPVHLVGHSYGGLLAFQLALRGRVPVASVAAFEPVCFGVLASANDTEGLAQLPDAALFTELPPDGIEGWLRRFVGFWQGPGAWDSLPPLARAPFLASGFKTFAEVRSLLAERTGHEAYRALRVPALLLSGELSPVAARRVCAILAENLPFGRHVSVAGAGHMGPLSHADAVNEAIAQHLAAAR